MRIVRPLPLSNSDFTTTVAEDDAPAWDIATTYAIGDQVVRLNRIYVSTIDSNTGNAPENENQQLTSARWLDIGATNAFRFIDGTIYNKTVSATSVTIDVANADGVDAIVFFGMKCSTIQVQGFDSGAVEIFNQTVSMSGRDVFNHYQWFTEPVGEASYKLAVTDLPPGISDLTITVGGTDLEIGEIVIGDLLEVGTTLMEPTEGEVRSLTRFNFNAYGNLERIKGPTRNVMRYGVLIPAVAYPRIKDRMDRLAGDIVAAIGSANRQTTIQVGILGGLRWRENLPNHYIVTFQIDGVT